MFNCILMMAEENIGETRRKRDSYFGLGTRTPRGVKCLHPVNIHMLDIID